MRWVPKQRYKGAMRADWWTWQGITTVSWNSLSHLDHSGLEGRPPAKNCLFWGHLMLMLCPHPPHPYHFSARSLTPAASFYGYLPEGSSGHQAWSAHVGLLGCRGIYILPPGAAFIHYWRRPSHTSSLAPGRHRSVQGLSPQWWLADNLLLLAAFPFPSHFPTPLPVLPGITSQITTCNHIFPLLQNS